MDTTEKFENAIEVGGPSGFFQDSKLYEKINNLVIVNFSTATVWLKEDKVEYVKGKIALIKPGEGTELSSLFPCERFDLFLSSHSLEHTANPIKMLVEAHKILKPEGEIIIIVPDKKTIFDRKRPDTTFEHLVDDFEKNVDEHDLTHLEEILSLHDLRLDPPAGTHEKFRERSLMNFENRCLHHHVFTQDTIKKCVEKAGFKIKEQKQSGLNLITVAKRS